MRATKGQAATTYTRTSRAAAKYLLVRQAEFEQRVRHLRGKRGPVAPNIGDNVTLRQQVAYPLVLDDCHAIGTRFEHLTSEVSERG